MEWLSVDGFQFTPEEAREASDFEEILGNFDLDPAACFGMFRCEDLTAGRRLVFAAKGSVDDVAFMILREPDDRLCGLMKRRLESARVEQDGGIVH